MKNTDKMIEVKNVSMRFNMTGDKINSLKEYFVQLVSGKIKRNEFWELSDVSFDVHKGEVVGIIGHNGAGKSTILKVISGILNPTKGEVQVHGNIPIYPYALFRYHQTTIDKTYSAADPRTDANSPLGFPAPKISNFRACGTAK